jgi:Gas vesicle synthesis protein GvpL/GvpF
MSAITAPGVYIYGLIRTGEDRDYGCIGLEHAGAPGRVRTLRAGSVAAVVSEFTVRSKVLPLRKNLDPHHRVIREVMKDATIIPMTFGHVAKSEDAVLKTLRRNKDAIRTELDRIDGKVEMSLKVFWDVANIFDHLVTSDEDLAAFRDQIFGRSQAPSQAEQIELGRRFQQLLDSEREGQTDGLVEAFRPCFSEVTANPPKGEKCLMDLAFLVERAKMKDFEDRVSQVAGTFPAHFLFDYGGPWAPFNFAELDLRT